MKIEIFDPAMCCSTGVCGPSVDPELVRIQEVLRQIEKHAPTIEVKRYSLSSEPQAFVDHSEVGDIIKEEGPDSLPLVFVDGTLISKGSYPANDQLQQRLQDDGIDVVLNTQKTSACGCAPGCC
ncbi:MAG: arsenite efflux transporter metallochaperone ArsD [Desulfuromonadaceae bacterium]